MRPRPGTETDVQADDVARGPAEDGPDSAARGLVVVGGGPAGLEAARAYREHGGTGPVRILTADEHPPYNRPPLSKDFLRGESEEDELPLEADAFYRDHDVEVRLRTEVVALHLDEHLVELADGSRLGFDTCVLATGSAPASLPVPGGDDPDLYVVRSRVHGRTLRDAAAQAGPAVVVGSGFIGCEAAASLALSGHAVTMLTAEPVPQSARLGDEVGERITGWLAELGVRVVAGSPVASIEGARSVRLEDGSTWSGDLVVVASGAVPQGDLAERAGLSVAEGRVLVDADLQTQVPGVYAAGDIAAAVNGAAGRRLSVEHWGEALRMGEIAGANAAGGTDSWAQVPGFWSEIGEHTIKYAAWGDGHDQVRFEDHGGGSFTAWYARTGTLVGVLTHDADDDYQRGSALVEQGRPLAALDA